ncbi:virion structural protein [Vibrio phage vB_VpaM_sm033]|nr:virion structural protein [Vibrio phage vB_VpaM_sm033]
MSTLTTPYRFQFDPLGNAPTNFVTWRIELQAINHLPQVAPYGLFYDQNLRVVRTSDGATMTKGVDYELKGWEKWVSEIADPDPYAAIDFLDKAAVDVYEVHMQVVGGPEGNPISMINLLKEAIDNAINQPDIDYNIHVKNKPSFFMPGPHKHVLQDMEDLYKLSQKFDDVFNALVMRVPMNNSGLHFQEQIDRLLGLLGRMYNRLNIVSGEVSTEYKDKLDQVLDLVSNYVRTEDDVAVITPSGTVAISTFALSEVSSLRGVVVLDTGTHVETVDFICSSGPGLVPNIQEMAVANTDVGNYFLELEAVTTNTSLVIQVKSSRGGELKVKYYSVL